MNITVKTERVVNIQMTEQEAGVLLFLSGLISGPEETLGRRVMDNLATGLDKLGIGDVCVFDIETEVRAIK